MTVYRRFMWKPPSRPGRIKLNYVLRLNQAKAKTAPGEPPGRFLLPGAVVCCKIFHSRIREFQHGIFTES